jgi:TfoX/Sxy family transcriptional regulator of competence genes
MASDRNFVDYICEQANLASALSYRKMFGEYAVYVDGKVIALICDNQLFVKPTAEGRAMLGSVSEHPPYPGAKPHFRIVDELEDGECLKRLFITTARVLPVPKMKRAKTKQAKTGQRRAK